MLRQHSFMPYIMVGFTSKRLLTKQVDICLLVEFFLFYASVMYGRSDKTWKEFF